MTDIGHNSGVAADELRQFVERARSRTYSGKDGRRLAHPTYRFWSNVEVQPAGCWHLEKVPLSSGYVLFYAYGRQKLAHRFAYQDALGEIPYGLVLDHLCRNPRCVNPNHLEAVSQSENVMRGRSVETTVARQKAKTHCPYGHPYFGPNLYVFGNGYRACRECAAVRRATYDRRHRSMAVAVA